MRIGKGVDQEEIEGDARDDRLDDDLARGEPVQQLAAVQHQLQRGDGEAEGGEAEKIEARGLRVAAFRHGEDTSPAKARMPIGRLM